MSESTEWLFFIGCILILILASLALIVCLQKRDASPRPFWYAGGICALLAIAFSLEETSWPAIYLVGGAAMLMSSALSSRFSTNGSGIWTALRQESHAKGQAKTPALLAVRDLFGLLLIGRLGGIPAVFRRRRRWGSRGGSGCAGSVPRHGRHRAAGRGGVFLPFGVEQGDGHQGDHGDQADAPQHPGQRAGVLAGGGGEALRRRGKGGKRRKGRRGNCAGHPFFHEDSLPF